MFTKNVVIERSTNKGQLSFAIVTIIDT